MSYESFRLSFVDALRPSLPDPEALLPPILAALDNTSASYDITRRTMDLIVSDGVPDAVRLYIASKSIQNISKGTLTNYYRVLRHFFQTVSLPLDQITTTHIRLYLNHYKVMREVKNNTVEGLRIILNGFFEWCADEELIPKNPVRRVEHTKYTDEERLPMSALELEIVRLNCKTIREKALVDFLYSSACRVAECTALNLSDINWQEHTVRIRHGKGDKARTTFLNAKSEVSLRAYLDTRDDTCEALFVSIRRPHHRLTSKAVQDEIKKIVSRCNLSVHVTPHIFRHTAASMALQRGMPIDQVQKFLGHAKIETTLRYAKILNFDVRQSHAKYVS